MGIPFTQFLRPDGRRRDVTIDRPDEIEAKAREIVALGYEFQCEKLIAGLVSFAIFDKEDERDIAIKVCANGPAVPDAVDRLIRDFEMPPGSDTRPSLGEIVTGSLLVPVGMALVALVSLADDANAATAEPVATGAGVLGLCLIVALMAWSLGYVMGLLTMAPRDPDDGRIDAPPALRTRPARNDRVRQ